MADLCQGLVVGSLIIGTTLDWAPVSTSKLMWLPESSHNVTISESSRVEFVLILSGAAHGWRHSAVALDCKVIHLVALATASSPFYACRASCHSSSTLGSAACLGHPPGAIPWCPSKSVTVWSGFTVTYPHVSHWPSVRVGMCQ